MESKRIATGKLTPNKGQIEGLPANPRQWTQTDIDRIARSLRETPELFEMRPCIVYPHGDKFVILGGNLRYTGAKANKDKDVPCIVMPEDTPIGKLKEIVVKDNSSFGSFDYDLLANEWDDLPLQDWGVPSWEGEAEPAAPEVKEDDFNEDAEVETRCNPGDIWQLGEHRLMCGDSTDGGNVALLMDGAKADMVFTDPPYGMHLDTDYSKYREDNEEYTRKYNLKNTKGNSYKPVIGDNEDFKEELVTTIFDNFDYCKEIFVWGGDYYPELLKDYKSGNFIVWDKKCNEGMENNLDTTNSNTFELCWSKKKHKKDIVRILWVRFFGTEQEFDHKRYHPTQKPSKLAKWFIDKYSNEHQLIVDLYGGSGSTLIAAEQLNRRCYMMELDPHYCDVIISRWETFTGKTAQLITPGDKVS